MANFYSFICRCNCGWLLGFALQTITAGFEEADLVFWRFKSFKSMVHAGLAMVVAIPFVQVFYFDVGENQRGRFLKVSEASVSRSRSTIIVPAGNSSDDGWAAFRNILVEIHETSQQLLPSPNSSGPSQVLLNAVL
jgi:hypothetical protein